MRGPRRVLLLVMDSDPIRDVVAAVATHGRQPQQPSGAAVGESVRLSQRCAHSGGANAPLDCCLTVLQIAPGALATKIGRGAHATGARRATIDLRAGRDSPPLGRGGGRIGLGATRACPS